MLNSSEPGGGGVSLETPPSLPALNSQENGCRVLQIFQAFKEVPILYLLNQSLSRACMDCCSIWSNSSVNKIHKLQLVQNYAARIILGLRKYDHVSEG